MILVYRELGLSLNEISNILDAPDSEAAQNWAKELQAFFTEHFYTCTPEILKGLAESYAGGGSMTENIDKVGGEGTGAFAKQVIDAYCK